MWLATRSAPLSCCGDSCDWPDSIELKQRRNDNASCAEIGVVGRLKVVNTPYPDPLQFDLKSSCFDPASNQNPSRARAGDLRFISAFSQVIKLAVLKADRF
ncbi:MAG: EVE domain-containing protein [Pseudomonadales bacterium]